jgi:hypothetical protein
MGNDSRYYIYSGKNSPTTFHETLGDAEREARRLAKLVPGIEFFILRAVKGIRYAEEPFIVTNYSKHM